MEIDVKDLPFEGGDFEGEEPAGILDLDGEENDLSVASGVRYAFHAEVAGEELIVRGAVNVDVAFQCSRCAQAFTARIEEPSFVTVRNLKEENAEQFVDLTPDIRESILLAFPSHPVCKPECKGLCPQCGANWNNKSCKCRPPPDERWGSLDMLETQS